MRIKAHREQSGKLKLLVLISLGFVKRRSYHTLKKTPTEEEEVCVLLQFVHLCAVLSFNPLQGCKDREAEEDGEEKEEEEKIHSLCDTTLNSESRASPSRFKLRQDFDLRV